MKEMHERWNKLMILTFLGALRLEISKARPNVIVGLSSAGRGLRTPRFGIVVVLRRGLQAPRLGTASMALINLVFEV